MSERTAMGGSSDVGERGLFNADGGNDDDDDGKVDNIDDVEMLKN